MTVSTLTVVPEASASGTAPCAEPDSLTLSLLARSTDTHRQALARAARADFPAWVRHVRAASACARPIRLHGTMSTIEAETGRLLSTVDTADLPDGVIYKPCGNRREALCPSCSARYKRDAYQIVRAGLVGGKGVPESVSAHPAVFPTFTAPSFGEVHTRYVRRHTCTKRKDCDCRPEPCHARRNNPRCPHGRPLACFARHADIDTLLGAPLCPDCYDYPAQVVWNVLAGELWRRTTEAIRKYMNRLARARGIEPKSIRLAMGKAAEMQRRGVVHFHAIIRLDGANPDDRGDRTILPPPPGFTAQDLVDAVDHAAGTEFTTKPHWINPDGWRIGWGDQILTKIIAKVPTGVDGEVTDAAVAAYLAKYATKSTEAAGMVAGRLTPDTIDLFANTQGTHAQRLVAACWALGRPQEWRRLIRWAHMLGFGGHFFTKSRTYSVSFGFLRDQRIVFRRTESGGPGRDEAVPEQSTTLVVNFLQFVGAGWHTTADAMLANTSAALAREHQQAAQAELATLAA
ncbi:replication initiator [Rugosimonospora africana]|uniref:Plasmid replication initiator protein n=1 Tax=Rugosimonospora africana TaxID=556532 RepID=A0A8J3VUY4_9ACTN|nr:replication initiator [Rugosimonospora africana]GIH19168.1 plasmid replication initiator protein [Rugosimonospora africana]